MCWIGSKHRYQIGANDNIRTRAACTTYTGADMCNQEHREVKDVIHPLMKHLHATLVIVGIYVCTCLLVLLVAHISAGVSGACRPGPDIIICSYGTELARVNRTFVLDRIET